MSRGHRIGKLAEIPLVIADSQINPIKKTKEAVLLLKKIQAYSDCLKSKSSRKIRPGKGKARGTKKLEN